MLLNKNELDKVILGGLKTVEKDGYISVMRFSDTQCEFYKNQFFLYIGNLNHII